MLDFYGSKIKSDFAMFMSKETGQPLEFWHDKLSRREIKPWKPSTEPFPVIKLEPIKPFDYRDLVKESKFNPWVRPSKSDVINFMVKEEGHTPESALFKLSSPKIDKIFVGGKFHSLGSNASFMIKGF